MQDQPSGVDVGLADEDRNGHLHWPHRGTLNWPRPALVVGVCK
jgi:hypothetical protein